MFFCWPRSEESSTEIRIHTYLTRLAFRECLLEVCVNQVLGVGRMRDGGAFKSQREGRREMRFSDV